MARQGLDEMSAELPVETTLEEPVQPQAAKGLVKRKVFYMVIIGFIILMLILAARDISKSMQSGGEKGAGPVSRAASAPVNLGAVPNPADIESIAGNQAQLAAQASMESKQNGVQPNLGTPPGNVPVQPNNNAPLPSARVGAPPPGGQQSGQAGRPGDAAGQDQQMTGEQAQRAMLDGTRAQSSLVLIDGDQSGAQGAIGAIAAQIPGPAGQAAQAAVDALGAQAAAQYGAEQAAAADANQKMVLNALSAAAGGQKVGGSIHPSAADATWLKTVGSEPVSKDVGTANRLPTSMVLLAGTRVPVVSLEAVNSDLPGQINARSTFDVRDSLNQRCVLLPAGTRFNGRYSSEIKPGQARVLMAFSRAVLPDGRVFDLAGAQSTDNLGRSGQDGSVNNHFFKMFGFSLATALIANRTEQNVTTTSGAGGTTTTGSVAGQVLSDISRQILQRNSSIPPTITLPVGMQFFIMINRDVALQPNGRC